MPGSGTSVTSTLFGLTQQLAFTPGPPCAPRRSGVGPGAAGTPPGPACPAVRRRCGSPRRSPELLEPAQVVVELLGGLLAEVLGHGLAQRAAGELVGEGHVHLGAAPARCGDEADLAGVGDVGAVERAPRDALRRDVVGRLGVPLDRLAERRARLPVAAARVRGAYLVEVRH